MKALSVFRPRVATRAVGCPDLLIDHAILDSCIEFCDRSLVVKRMLTSFLTTVNVAQYTITPPAESMVADVVRMWSDSTELTPLDEDAIDSPFGFVAAIPGQTFPAGAPRYFNETDPGIVSLYPRPDKAYTINLRVALKPSRSATQVEDQLFDEWVEPIVDGALARLYAMPNEFGNPTLAKYHMTEFDIGVNSAMLEARRGKNRAQSRVTPVHI